MPFLKSPLPVSLSKNSTMAKVNLLYKLSWNSLSRWTPKLCGSIPLLAAGGVVYAETEKDKSLVKVAEISLYNNPEAKNSYTLKEEKYTTLKDYVNTARVAFNDMMEPQWERIEDVKDKIAIGKAHSAALVDRLRSDKELQRKITIVGGSSFATAGIGFSMVERGKKGTMLTLFFGLLGGAVAMVVLHPNEALNLVGFSPEEADKKDSESKK